MKYGLCRLFDVISGEEALLDDDFRLDAEPERLDADKPASILSVPDLMLAAGLYVPPTAGRLFELSVNAFDAVVHAWMSERSIDAEVIRFGRKVLAAGERKAAAQVATDRGDPDVRVVLDAADQFQHEVHRLQGLLRFSPTEDGVYIARCEPDHLVLPLLGDHFSLRFGDTPWVIIDEKRRLCLSCPAGERPVLMQLDKSPDSAGALAFMHTAPAAEAECFDDWEKLWRQYHKTINNEGRSNPAVQTRFMPKRYWKYLPEM